MDASNKTMNGYTSTPTGPIGAGGSVVQTLFIDFNGDGAPDLISVGCGGSATSLSVSLSQFDSSAPTTNPNNRSFAAAQCVDASAPFAKMNSLHGISLTLGYSTIGARAFIGAGVPSNTWVALQDFNGDGVADYIIADPNSATWYVYPGYVPDWLLGLLSAVPDGQSNCGAPAGSGGPNAYPIRSVVGPMPGSNFDATLCDISGPNQRDRCRGSQEMSMLQARPPSSMRPLATVPCVWVRTKVYSRTPSHSAQLESGAGWSLLIRTVPAQSPRAIQANEVPRMSTVAATSSRA